MCCSISLPLYSFIYKLCTTQSSHFYPWNLASTIYAHSIFSEIFKIYLEWYNFLLRGAGGGTGLFLFFFVVNCKYCKSMIDQYKKLNNPDKFINTLFLLLIFSLLKYRKICLQRPPLIQTNHGQCRQVVFVDM